MNVAGLSGRINGVKLKRIRQVVAISHIINGMATSAEFSVIRKGIEVSPGQKSWP